MTPAEKHAIVEEARGLMLLTWGPETTGRGDCLYAAAALLLVGKKYRLPWVLQAGTLAWRLSDAEEGPNAFGFEWEPGSPASIEALREGRLPEMHAWVGDTEKQELIDITTGRLPLVAAALGHPWGNAPRPPDYLWCGAAEIPGDAFYQPVREATIFAAEKVIELIVSASGGAASRRRIV